MTQVETTETATTETHVNPAVVTGESLNTKPVTRAKAQAKAGGHGKSKAKVARATKAADPVPAPKAQAKATVKGDTADKPVKAGDLAAYYQLDQWPKALGYGRAPSRNELVIATAIQATKGQSKQLLAAAAYFKPDALKYSDVGVGFCVFTATGAVGVPDVKRNVITNLQLQHPCPVITHEGKGFCHTGKARISHRLTLTKAGVKRVLDYVTAHQMKPFDLTPYSEPGAYKHVEHVAPAPDKATDTALPVEAGTVPGQGNDAQVNA